MHFLKQKHFDQICVLNLNTNNKTDIVYEVYSWWSKAITKLGTKLFTNQVQRTKLLGIIKITSTVAVDNRLRT